MDIVELIIANFIGFGFALLVYAISQIILGYREKNKEKLMQNNFLMLIKDEINFNTLALKELLKLDLKHGVTPARLKIENKNGCWIKIIEYRHRNPELINKISNLYFLFTLINQILDLVPHYFSDIQDTSEYLENVKENIKKASKQCSKLSKDVIKNINQEIKSKGC
jgi:hypothetical protein